MSWTPFVILQFPRLITVVRHNDDVSALLSRRQRVFVISSYVQSTINNNACIYVKYPQPACYNSVYLYWLIMCTRKAYYLRVWRRVVHCKTTLDEQRTPHKIFTVVVGGYAVNSRAILRPRQPAHMWDVCVYDEETIWHEWRGWISGMAALELFIKTGVGCLTLPYYTHALYMHIVVVILKMRKRQPRKYKKLNC